MADPTESPEPQISPAVHDKLTPEQVQKATAWLEAKWSNRACPFHGVTNWELDDQFGSVSVFVRGRQLLGGPVFPFVVLTCQTCGYTVLINAIRAGLLDPDPPLDTSPDPAPVGEHP